MGVIQPLLLTNEHTHSIKTYFILTSFEENPILWFMESEKLAQLVKFISRENVKLKAKLKAQEDEIEALHDLLKQKEKNDRYN